MLWRTRRAVGVAGVLLLAAIATTLVAGVAGTSAHAELTSSDPPADGLLTTTPELLTLTFTEPLAADGASPSIRLLDDQGRDQGLEQVIVLPQAEKVVQADVPDLAPGTYTVSWSVRSATDGHTLSGTFAFRVGGGRAPGAATVEDGDPRAWSVATRWLTFLGAALLAGGAAYALVVAPGTIGLSALGSLVSTGAVVGMVATVSEPVLYQFFPPEGVRDPSLQSAIDDLPNAWWFRPVALVLGAIVAVAWWGLARRGRIISQAVPAVACVAGLAALLGLSLTGHGAGRDGLRWLAVASDYLHQSSIALWVGTLVALVVVGSGSHGPSIRGIGGRTLLGIGSTGAAEPIERFSRLALPLVIAGVTAGILNTSLILPSIERLWISTYGRVILAKVLVLLPVLLLATFHRRRIRERVAGMATALKPTLRLETGLAVAIVLGGSTLAMLAPPRSGGATPSAPLAAASAIDLAAPIDPTLGDAGPALHLRVDPVAPGVNGLEIYLSGAAAPPSPGQRLVFRPETSVALAFTSLSHTLDTTTALATLDGGTGSFRVDGLNLSLDGWWEVDIVVRGAQAAEFRQTFLLLLGDPNIYGSGIVRAPEPDAAAEAVFDLGLTAIAGLHSVRYSQRIADGTGNVAQIEVAARDGSDGQPAARSQTTGRIALIGIGETEWLRRSDGQWTERDARQIVPPSEQAETYIGATDFHLGPASEIAGEPVQVVSFYVPATDIQSEAWYVWWVSSESAEVLREGMVARSHYMYLEYRDFNDPVSITPPDQSGASATPVGTPIATTQATPIPAAAATPQP